MSVELVNTLWGQEVMETNPCNWPDCDESRHSAGKSNTGKESFHAYCSKHHKAKYLLDNWVYKQHRLNYCENIDGRLGFKCTTTIVMSAQLTIDHIDANRENDELSNLQTLCACCHAVKTKINGDNLMREHRPNAEQKALRWQKFMESLNTNGEKK